MKYLEAFLAEHGAARPAQKHAAPVLPKLTEGAFGSFGSAPPARLELASLPALAQGLAVREVMSFRATWLVELPLPPRLVLELPGLFGIVQVDLTRPARAGAFDCAEWLAIVRAAESERARAADARAWVEHKRSAPGWRLTEDEATRGPVSGLPAPSWTTGRVLGQLGATLRAVVIPGDGGSRARENASPPHCQN